MTFQQLTKERKRRQAAASNLFASSGGSHSGKKGCSTPNSIYNYVFQNSEKGVERGRKVKRSETKKVKERNTWLNLPFQLI